MKKTFILALSLLVISVNVHAESYNQSSTDGTNDAGSAASNSVSGLELYTSVVVDTSCYPGSFNEVLVPMLGNRNEVKRGSSGTTIQHSGAVSLTLASPQLMADGNVTYTDGISDFAPDLDNPIGDEFDNSGKDFHTASQGTPAWYNVEITLNGSTAAAIGDSHQTTNTVTCGAPSF
jgi:hypothetical protein